MLKVENLTIQWQKNQNYLIQNLSFEVPKGKILTLMGPSGSGKSTILNCLCGTLPSDFFVQGEFFLEEELLNEKSPEKRKVGILYQDPLLFPHFNIYENLAFGIPSYYKKKEKKEKVISCLCELEMEGFETRFPATLSGGQQARVALMRSLLSEPKVLLLDEPFSKLDSSLKDKIRKVVFSYIRKNQLAAILVTHSHQDAKAAKGGVIDLKEYSNNF